MNEQTTKKDNQIENGLNRVFAALVYKFWLIVLVAIICAALTFVMVFYCVTPLYESSAMFYVNNSDLSVGDTVLNISAGDITAAKNLVESYIVILNTRTTLNEVIDYAQVDISASQLQDMISAAAVESTEIFEVIVTGPNPEEAEKLASAIAYILPKRIDSIIVGTSARIVDAAIIPTKPSSPNYFQCTLLGFVFGLVLTAAIIVLQEVFDITIRTEEDMAQVCRHPVLAAVPDMAAPSKGGYYYYGYGNNKRRNQNRSGLSGHHADPVLFGGNISFAASEAYKLLRTKLQFSFTDERNSRVIGFSSALSGEGKSLSAINLAYSLSQLDKKVILIDCDMRRPTLSDKLSIRKQPGLSGYLTGQHRLEGAIQYCNLKNEEEAFHVIAAGLNPPNPIELLSSERMIRFLQELRTRYDYIILDLPPVGEVSDAMAVAKETDGMLLVVRQNYCDRVVLKEAVRQFEFINARILGVVYNCATENGGRYGKNYYKKYYRRYYGRSYAHSHHRYEGAYVSKKVKDEAGKLTRSGEGAAEE